MARHISFCGDKSRAEQVSVVGVTDAPPRSSPDKAHARLGRGCFSFHTGSHDVAPVAQEPPGSACWDYRFAPPFLEMVSGQHSEGHTEAKQSFRACFRTNKALSQLPLLLIQSGKQRTADTDHPSPLRCVREGRGQQSTGYVHDEGCEGKAWVCQARGARRGRYLMKPILQEASEPARRSGFPEEEPTRGAALRSGLWLRLDRAEALATRGLSPASAPAAGVTGRVWPWDLAPVRSVAEA